jgi:hypothetical protein
MKNYAEFLDLLSEQSGKMRDAQRDAMLAVLHLRGHGDNERYSDEFGEAYGGVGRAADLIAGAFLESAEIEDNDWGGIRSALTFVLENISDAVSRANADAFHINEVEGYEA